jgi:hypothetical protein
VLNRRSTGRLSRLTHMTWDADPSALQLDEYQEQPYLLDPHLETLLSPLIAAFRNQIKSPKAQLDTPRLERISHLIYFFTKVRGAKTIGQPPNRLRPACPTLRAVLTGAPVAVSLFPHEVSDLSILLRALTDEHAIGQASWQTRYILLLWLSLVCRLPFALERLGGEAGASAGATIAGLGMQYLRSSSKENEGAAALLARFYSR